MAKKRPLCPHKYATAKACPDCTLMAVVAENTTLRSALFWIRDHATTHATATPVLRGKGLLEIAARADREIEVAR